MKANFILHVNQKGGRATSLFWKPTAAQRQADWTTSSCSEILSMHTHTHLYTHMVRRTKKRSTRKNNSLMMSFAASVHSPMFHSTWFPAKSMLMKVQAILSNQEVKDYVQISANQPVKTSFFFFFLRERYYFFFRFLLWKISNIHRKVQRSPSHNQHPEWAIPLHWVGRNHKRRSLQFGIQLNLALLGACSNLINQLIKALCLISASLSW